MNILYLVPYTPTPIRTRPYNLIRSLARRGHQLTLATVWENDQEREALHDLEHEGIRVISARLTKLRSAWNSLCALPGATPFQAVYCWQPALAEAVVGRWGPGAGGQELEVRSPSAVGGRRSSESEGPCEIIHIEHLRGARYGLFLKSQLPATSFQLPAASHQLPASSFQPPLIWDSVDCISYLFEQAARQSRSAFGRLMARLELGRTRRYEGWLVGQFDRVLVTSAVDKAALESLTTVGGRRSAVEVLPNGVDLSYFTPDDTPRDPAAVIFTGKMSYHANITAALHLVNDIMPLVWRERPEVRVIIAGKDPPRVIQNLIPPDARHMTPDASRMTHDASRIMVTGAVPDLRPYLRRATVAAVPILYGAGIQNKVLEAMACGTPVVASPQAVAALQARDGEDLLVAGDAETFARHILNVLADPALARRLSAAGRRYVETHHDWNRIAGELEAIYTDALRGRQA